MKNIKVTLFLFFVSFALQGQIYYADYIKTLDSLELGGRIINNFSNDTTLADGDSSDLVTEHAVKKFVENNYEVWLTNAAPVGNFTFKLAVDTLDIDSLYFNNNNIWVLFAVAGGGGGTDDQTIDEFQISSNTLSISLENDGEAAKTVDLSPYLDNTDNQLTNEQVEDIVGGMTTGNTETGVTVTYQDGDGTLDFVADVQGVNDQTNGIDITLSSNNIEGDLNIDELTAEAIVDGAADYIAMLDATTGQEVKVLIDNLPSGTDDQTIDVSQLNFENIELSLEGDGEATKQIDLSTINFSGDMNRIALGNVLLQTGDSTVFKRNATNKMIIDDDGVKIASSGSSTSTEILVENVTDGSIETRTGITTDVLEGGVASPGNDKYYGTDNGGTKGFHDLPSGGGASQLTDLSDVNTATNTSGNILVADGVDFESVAVSGDATLAANGALSLGVGVVDANELASTAVVSGSYTSADITVDEDGRITSASNGSGGGGGDFSDGGDTAGADRTLGNNDNFDLGIETNGTTRVHIEGGGNVGIGTTSPADLLHVEGGTGLTVEKSGGAGVSRVIRTDGKAAAIIAGGGFAGFYFDETGDFAIQKTTNATIQGTSFPSATDFVIDGANGNVGINGVPDGSAKLEVESIVSGVLLPRMTTSQRNSITSPATGLIIYDTDEDRFSMYDGTAWLYLGILERLDLSGEVTADQSVQSGRNYIVDPGGGTVTLDPPTTPNEGDWFSVVDSRGNASGTNKIVIDFITGGDNLHASSQNAEITTSEGGMKFVYKNATIGWVTLAKY